jgi:hypothetical protein
MWAIFDMPSFQFVFWAYFASFQYFGHFSPLFKILGIFFCLFSILWAFFASFFLIFWAFFASFQYFLNTSIFILHKIWAEFLLNNSLLP